MYETMLFGKAYHFSANHKGVLVLHRGDAKKCKRVHYKNGVKI